MATATTTKKFDLRKVVAESTTPVYAYIGMTDLAVEKIREAGLKANETAAKNRADFAAFPGKVSDAATKFMTAAQEAPATYQAKAKELAEKAQESYEDLATRGERLVDRIRNQKTTQELVDQAKATVAMGEGAVTTARKAFADVERSAKATVTTGRKEAAKVAESVAADVKESAAETKAEVTGAAKRTRTAAKRTSTTAKKSATKTRTATKRAATGARNTAKAGTKAAADAGTKVGD